MGPARLIAGLLAMLLLSPPPAAASEPAVTLRLCIADQPFYPFTMPDGSGQHQRLVKLATRGLPLHVSVYMAPRPRCMQDLRLGLADATIGVFTAERQAFAAYPMRGTEPDPRQALGDVQFVAYRRAGSAVGWDGQRFEGLGGGAIGVLFGFAYGPKLAGLNLPIDDRAISHEQLMQKLERGRNPVIIVQEQEGNRLIAQRYAGRIERLSPLFEEFTLYLMVARAFQARHPELVARYWRGIEAARQLPEYRQYRPAPAPVAPERPARP